MATERTLCCTAVQRPPADMARRATAGGGRRRRRGAQQESALDKYATHEPCRPFGLPGAERGTLGLEHEARAASDP